MYFSIILTWCVLVTSAHIEIQKIPDSTPMLFNPITEARVTYDNVKIVYYINMTEYFELINVINKTVKISEDICNGIPEDICDMQITQLKSQLANVIRDDREIKAQRKPRAICEICGTAAYYVYGVMDAPRAREYAKAINNLSEEQKTQHALMENTTTLFQLFLKNNKKSFNQIYTDLNNLESTLFNLSTSIDFYIDKLQMQSKLHSIVQLASSKINEHFQLFQHLRGALSSVKDHRIPDFIPLNQLSEDIIRIAANLKNGQQLPVAILKEDPIHVLEHATFASILIENLLLTEITIPTVEKDQYTLFKATPIPVQTPSGRLIATIPNPYFLLNDMQTEFIPLSKKEVSHSRKISSGTHLFRPSATTHLNNENVCAWKIMMESSIESALASCNFVPLIENDIIISIIENESYFFATKFPTKLWEICDQKTNNVIQIEGRNIIQLNDKCFIKSSSFIIKPHRTFVFNESNIIVPSISSTQNTLEKLNEWAETKSAHIAMPNHIQLFAQNDDELDDIIKQSNILASAAKHEFKMDKLVYESRQYSFISSASTSIAILIIISILVFLAYKKFNIISTVLNAVGLLNNNRIPPAIKIGLNDVEQPRPPPTPYVPRREIETINEQRE